jgi:hypothetical protein
MLAGVTKMPTQASLSRRTPCASRRRIRTGPRLMSISYWLLTVLAVLLQPTNAYARLGPSELDTADRLLSSFITANPTLAVCYINKDLIAHSPTDCSALYMNPSEPKCGHAYRCCIACNGGRACRTTKERCANLARQAQEWH